MTDHETRLLSEYDNAHSAFHHYDSFRWQSGSMLIAAAVVLWGFLFSAAKVPTITQVAIASTFVSLLLSCWILYAHHYRQLYMTKLFRIHEIEHELGMKLNTPLGFLGMPKVEFKIHPPKGHYIDIAVYVFVSLFGPAYWLVASDKLVVSRSWLWLILSPSVIAVALSWVGVNERKMREAYQRKAAKLEPRQPDSVLETKPK